MRSTAAPSARTSALSSLPALVSLSLSLSLAALGCSDGSTSGASSGGAADPGVELAALVPESGRVFVDLSGPAVIDVPEGAAASTAWDLAFEGYEVYTNSGLSGPGEGGALGPYGPDIYVSGVDPGSPIITRDAIGGAFLRWYAYDYTNPAHALYSRYHVFGVKDGDRLWKVQILSYYGEVEGAPVSAMYRLRYAEVKKDAAASETMDVVNIDGTAGGATGSEDTPSECLDLATGDRVKLAPKDAVQSAAWHLCFRRETISVNGELGGPRGVGAVDLEAALTPSETVEGLADKTAESELARFDAVTYEALNAGGLAWRGDRVVSIFADQWALPDASPPAPVPATWVVVHAADGEARSLVTFSRFEAATGASPGEVVMRVRPVVK
jgi:hypothetical protein